jgi:hypothetical protein
MHPSFLEKTLLGDRTEVAPHHRHTHHHFFILIFFLYFIFIFLFFCLSTFWAVFTRAFAAPSVITNRTIQNRRTNTNIHALSEIRTHDSSNQAAKTHASLHAAAVTGPAKLNVEVKGYFFHRTYDESGK